MQQLETEIDEKNYNAFVHSNIDENYSCMNILRLFLRQIYKAVAIFLVWVILAILNALNKANNVDVDTDKKETTQLESLIEFLVFCWLFSVIYDIYEVRYGHYTIKKNLMWVPFSCFTCWLPLNCMNYVGCGTRDCLRSMFKCWWYYTSCLMCCGSLRNPISNPTMFIASDIAFNDVVADSI